MANVIAETVREAYRALRRDSARVLRLAIGPAFLLVSTKLVPSSNSFLDWTAELLAFGAYVALAVAIHRHVLLSDSEKARPATVKTHVTFGLAVIAVSVLGVMFVMPVSMLGNLMLGNSPATAMLLGLVASVLAFYFVARLSLALPDRAIGRAAAVADVWRWSTNNGWNLVGVLFLPAFIVNLPVAIISSVSDTVMGQVVTALASIPVLIFEVALLSCAYRSLRRLHNAA